MRRKAGSWRSEKILLSTLLVAIFAIALSAGQNDDKSSDDNSNDSHDSNNSNNNKGLAGTGQRSEDLSTSQASHFYLLQPPSNRIYYPLHLISFMPFLYAAPSSSRSNNGGNSCGDQFTQRCKESRLRSYDGSCNNLKHPTWGMANTRYQRLVPPRYGDGRSAPTISVKGSKLPSARLISTTIFPIKDIDDPIWTLAAMQWGQVITHDMSRTAGNPQLSKHDLQCCTNNNQLIPQKDQARGCYAIGVPRNDPFYSKVNVQCLEFSRTMTDVDNGCKPVKKSAEQLTTVTHYLDLSLVYGSSKETANRLRSGRGGRLKVDVRDKREWLPAPANKTALCDLNDEGGICYEAGDVRVNQNTQLTVLHTILMREHNRIADYLAKLNPHWTDETIYQETRRILIAEHQQISYYEWLPIFLGDEAVYDAKILYDTKGFVNDYDPDVDPSVLNEHATAAFRYFHTLIAGHLNLVNEHRAYNTQNSLRMSDYFDRPGIIEQGKNMDDLTRGLAHQAQKDADRYFDKEITQYLFRNGRQYGSDLRAIDVQRDRDHGLASYNDVREHCGHGRAKSFKDFLDLIDEDNARRLANLYESPDDVELTVAGSLEDHVEGALVGPTFLCILEDQFYRTRVGDRYWFERGDPDISFTKEQLAEIRKASISRLFCDNGDKIKYMQPQGFLRLSENNPLVKCDDLPEVDLSLWKDYAPQTRGNDKKK